MLDRDGLRPTPDRVRETLFNWLGQDLAGWSVLDAFAGTGALGFEAASRGAKPVICLERDPALVSAMLAVKERLGASAIRVLQADAMSWMASAAAAGSCDLVLLDPPFGQRIHGPAIERAIAVLKPSGWLYVEADVAMPVSGGMVDFRHLRAGLVHAHLWRKGQEAAAKLPDDTPVQAPLRRSTDDDDDRED